MAPGRGTPKIASGGGNHLPSPPPCPFVYVTISFEQRCFDDRHSQHYTKKIRSNKAINGRQRSNTDSRLISNYCKLAFFRGREKRLLSDGRSIRDGINVNITFYFPATIDTRQTRSLSSSLLERDESGGVGGADAGPTVLHGLVRDAELAEVVANHLGLKTEMAEMKKDLVSQQE